MSRLLPGRLLKIGRRGTSQCSSDMQSGSRHLVQAVAAGDVVECLRALSALPFSAFSQRVESFSIPKRISARAQKLAVAGVDCVVGMHCGLAHVVS